MIETEGLTKRFGEVTAVEGVTLRVDKGEVFGFLGPNGAGKTTTVRMLTCLISKTAGRAWINGREVGEGGDVKQIRRMIGLLPESVGFYDDMTVTRNLDFYGKLYDMPEAERRDRIEHLTKLLGLWETRDLRVGTLSKGTKQRVAIARSLIHDPLVVFLDEPTANLDPEASKTIREFILELKAEGKTVFLNTHNLDEAQRVCDRVGIMKGKLLAAGQPDVLRRSLWPRRTEIRARGVTESVVASIRRMGGWDVQVEDERLVVNVEDPTEDNPRIIKALVDAGVKVLYVQELSPTLEDVYLKLIRS